MPAVIFSINHHDHGLNAVEVATPLAQGELELTLMAHPSVNGAMVLSTCNRIEIAIDTDNEEAATGFVTNLLASQTSVGPNRPVLATTYRGNHVVEHLCALACGLKSMVVGEREIVGQLRHAHRRALARHTLSAPLVNLLDTAYRAARLVERETGLSGMGRSIVAIALDYAEKFIGNYSDITVTLFGTGSYAGATVTNLIDRGCRNIIVHSTSGRAESFARGRGLTAVGNEGIAEAISRSQLIVSCRGLGSPTVTVEHVAHHMRACDEHRERPLVVLDLAVVKDVERGVGEVPGVELIDLETVRGLVPELEPRRLARARHIVDEVVRKYCEQEAARALAPAVVAIRRAMERHVEAEIESLPQRMLTREDAQRALRRLSNRVLHPVMVAIQQAGAHSDPQRVLDAITTVTGLTFAPHSPQHRGSPIDDSPVDSSPIDASSFDGSLIDEPGDISATMTTSRQKEDV